MGRKLKQEDRQAVDLLLDRQFMQDGNAYIPPDSASPKRVESVEKILSILQQMPTQDPPSDLAGRTLRRVDQALGSLTPRPAGMPPAAGDERPSA